MKFATFAMALAGAATVNALGELGFDLGVQRNSDAACKETADYLENFKNMAFLTNTVRTYAVSDCGTLANMGPALVQSGFKAFLGVWPTDAAHFAAEQAALTTYLPTISINNVHAITVGSEALYRGDLTAEQLATAIDTVKTLIAGLKDKDGQSWASVPVGTVDSWNVLVNGANEPAIKAADIVLANAFSYWQGQVQANASYSFFDDIMQAIQTIQTIKGTTDIPFWVGETGWATAGGSFESAVPDIANAESFWQNGICTIRAWGINTIVFEAYDESWKPPTSGIDGVEQHWGVLLDDGTPKYNLTCAY